MKSEKVKTENKVCFQFSPFSCSQRKSGDDKRDAEGEREKMFAVDAVASFEQAMENCEKRKRYASDHCAEKTAEQRADDKNYRAARAARNASPQNADQRKQQNHFRPRCFFNLSDDSADKSAGKIADDGRN